MGDIKCFECNGTGSSVPDCYLCQGYRTVKAKRAYAFGWKKGDLIDLENDGYAECPQCYDEARTCMFCYGEGAVSQLLKDQQRNRVLIAASRRGKMPPCFTYEHRSHRIVVDENIDLLSGVHAGELKRDHCISWYCSVFGDEIFLTPKGEEYAKIAWKEYRALCKQWVSDERERRLERQLVAMLSAVPRIQEEVF